jgi:hypothetical protein
VHCFEGSVEIFSPSDEVSQTVGRGQSLEVTSQGTREIQATPPEVARQFASETDVPKPQREGVDEDASTEANGSTQPSQSTGDKVELSGIEDQEGVETAVRTVSQDAAQNQTVQNTVENIEETGGLKKQVVGYITAMLTRFEEGAKAFQHLYISDKPQDFSMGSKVQARDRLGGNGFDNPLLLVGDGGMEFDRDAEDPMEPRLKRVDVNSENGVETITGPYGITDHMLGYNEFLEWGYWTQPQIMTCPSGAEFLIDNRGYYVHGRATTDREMSELTVNSVKGRYSGSAWGTCWTETGGSNMSGTFSADVSFGDKHIRNFNVSVSGGGHHVSIGGASGKFSGETSQFVINPHSPGSVWQINGQDAPPAKKEAYGSIYGPGGEKIGGVWKLDAPSGNGEAHATGMFEGTR